MIWEFDLLIVTITISRIIEDLIHGELCQMESIRSSHADRYKQESAQIDFFEASKAF